ncbi:MAG TPA: winged helix-turn-helix domain-containing protein [Anaerolineales bacterium]|nr:winged helix-turn-helix domain-containing protein [Anaerolineales bacterium]
MPATTEWPLPFPTLSKRVLGDLAAGECAAVRGLSNTGKSSLMRSLAGDPSETLFRRQVARPITLVYVDCNRAVAISAQAFYEVVLRSILERLVTETSPELAAALRSHHQAVTEASTSFTASLAFNLALTEVCERLGSALGLLLDEFDEVYAALEDRALLNLRALRDRFSDRLSFVTATLRGLEELRGRDVEDEFAEMFARSTYTMPPLEEADAGHLLEAVAGDALDAEARRLCLEQAGGHPGLLVAVAQALMEAPAVRGDEARQRIRGHPAPRAECLKIWGQLQDEEQVALTSLASDESAGLSPQQRRRLETLGIVHNGKIFSPLLADFAVRRQHGAGAVRRGVEIDTDSGDVWVDGLRVPVLTDLEYRLLETLNSRRDKLTDKYQIVTAVWGEKYLGEVDDARVEKLVSRLRSKIEADPADPRYLLTQRGRGYKLLSAPLPDAAEA